jgi:hypothetical protein
MGGTLISVRDGDPAFALQNPAALNINMDRSLTFQYHFIFDGIGDGYVSFARHFDKADLTGHAGIQFIQYGTLKSSAMCLHTITIQPRISPRLMLIT